MCKRKAPTLQLRIGSKTELWNKIMTEVKDKRYAGPFKKPPFKYFIQSPVGLVTQGQREENKTNFPPFLSQDW